MHRPVFLCGAYSAVQALLFMLVSIEVVYPYMDEIFHVPQAIAYCQRHFDVYDPKLTTPPGLYLISSVLHGMGIPCTITYLRLLNVVIGTSLLPLLFGNIRTEYRDTGSMKATPWNGLIAAMPVTAFFQLLYYTDLVSTYLVFLMYLLVLKRRRYSAVTVARRVPLA